MPTYDYQCQNCKQMFEVFATLQQKQAGLQPECPECHSTKTQQAFRTMRFMRSSGGAGSGPMAGCGPIYGPGCC